jgi:mannose-P-dolichol utilization defect protein 1
MYALGSLTRIFTTLQEVHDVILLSGFIGGAFLNLILSFQMVYYWKPKQKKWKRTLI